MINTFLLNKTAQKLWEEYKATALTYDWLRNKTNRTVDETQRLNALTIKRIGLLTAINKEF